jgi:hypothetical protein
MKKLNDHEIAIVITLKDGKISTAVNIGKVSLYDLSLMEANIEILKNNFLKECEKLISKQIIDFEGEKL